MMEEMVITVITPITMPRIVSPLRSLFARSVSSAIWVVSRTSPRVMRYASARRATIGSSIAACFAG